MKNYLIQYKPFLLFLGKFFICYLLLTIVYNMYLNSFGHNQMDLITKFVATNTEYILKILDNQSYLIAHKNNLYYQIFYKQIYVARIIEGCNGISVIVLFLSFVFAFSRKWKPTLFFMLMGSLIIYTLNVFRIVLLSVLLFHFPQYEQILHAVVFPLIIYGTVFILWVFWVNKFFRYAR